jgi:hypothetical protein
LSILAIANPKVGLAAAAVRRGDPRHHDATLLNARWYGACMEFHWPKYRSPQSLANHGGSP